MISDDLVRNLRDSQFFHLDLVDWQGKQAVKKSPKEGAPQTRIDRLKNDVYGMKFFAGLAANNPSLKLYSPEVFEAGDNYYIREYILEDPVVKPEMSLEEAVPRLQLLADLLAGIDRIEPYGEVRFVGSSNYQKLHGSIAEWSDENLRDGIITQKDADAIADVAAGLGSFIRPRIAHGDMSPYKHAYFRDGKIALIDFENFTPQAARYFDVAWTYTRLWSFASSTEIPKKFLSQFMESADTPENMREQLTAVLLQRILGMQKDAEVDVKGKGTDYRGRARELLDLILQNKLELLHG